MDKKAIISIVSNASMMDDEKIEVISPGKFIDTEDGYKAIYEETEISGMEGTTTSLTIRDNEVVLEREGTTSTKMVFNETEASMALYNTPYGMLEITIITNELKVDMNEDGGALSIEYDMIVAGQKPLSTSLQLHIKTQK